MVNKEKNKELNGIFPITGGITRMPLRTATLLPATHTNCYLVGDESFLVIDPGSLEEEEQQRLDHEIRSRLDRGATFAAIWLTHHHGDHVSGVVHLVNTFNVPVFIHEKSQKHIDISTERLHEHSEHHDNTVHLSVVYTPGHTQGHCCFFEKHSQIMIVGDLVASKGTIVISPPEGDMSLYLESLKKVRTMGPECMLPAHGEPIVNVSAKLTAYLRHYQWRAQRIVHALTHESGLSAPDLLCRVYDDVSPQIHGLAMQSLLSHLNKLAQDGTVDCSHGLWRLSH